MTAEQAKKNQDRIQESGFNLGWWYGVHCEKCCEVYPEFRTTEDSSRGCYYECEVCGKRTEVFDMPWQATEAWNNHEYKPGLHQLSLF